MHETWTWVDTHGFFNVNREPPVVVPPEYYDCGCPAAGCGCADETLFAIELFEDAVWDTATKLCEGNEGRRSDILEKMWERPEHAAVREKCELQAKRIVGRRS